MKGEGIGARERGTACPRLGARTLAFIGRSLSVLRPLAGHAVRARGSLDITPEFLSPRVLISCFTHEDKRGAGYCVALLYFVGGAENNYSIETNNGTVVGKIKL